jgi:acetyl-CoA carboxylase carboxyl transferase subunit alpha
MAESQTRQFLDFEKPIKELFDQIEQLKQTAEKNKIDLSESINQLHEKIEEKKKVIEDYETKIRENEGEIEAQRY